MKNIFLILLFFTTIIHSQNIELAVSGAQQTQMPIAIILRDHNNDELNTIARIIKKDLAFTDQFAPSIEHYSSATFTQKNIQALANKGIPLALCIDIKSPTVIEWRLYDTIQCTMLEGKKYKKKGTAIRGWGHAIADRTRKALTGNGDLFSSRLVYCKNAKTADGKTVRNIFISDFDGTHEELVASLSSIAIAPRWHIKNPDIFYSEYTDTKVQLKSISIAKKNSHKSLVPSLDASIAMNMSFYENGKDYVFCGSRANGSCQIYLNKDDKIKRCTKNIGNNIAPIVIDQERICFCSDFQTGRPQIYIGNIETGHLQRITKGGYCTSPRYCAQNNKIAYHMMIQGTMQIMLYDCATKTHTQFTYDDGNKHEVSWSPDGTFIMYNHEKTQQNSCLAIANIATKKTRLITKATDQCSYPDWSPCYTIFPVTT